MRESKLSTHLDDANPLSPAIQLRGIPMCTRRNRQKEQKTTTTTVTDKIKNTQTAKENKGQVFCTKYYYNCCQFKSSTPPDQVMKTARQVTFLSGKEEEEEELGLSNPLNKVYRNYTQDQIYDIEHPSGGPAPPPFFQILLLLLCNSIADDF